MATRFRPYHPEQSDWLAPSPSEWRPEGPGAYLISDVGDDWNLASFDEPYPGDGRRNSPYDPRMLWKVVVYAYASGVFRARKMARKLEEAGAFRVLGAGHVPDPRTVHRFRQEPWEEWAGILQHVVKRGREGQAAKKLLPCAENPPTQVREPRLNREQGQRWYRKRKRLAEPPFGGSKHVLGFPPPGAGGLKKVPGEWPRVCAA